MASEVKLDGRRRHVMHLGELCVVVRFTRECSGCFEGGDYMGMAHLYPYDKKARCYVGAGCEECGYTGKRRQEDVVPASVFYRSAA